MQIQTAYIQRGNLYRLLSIFGGLAGCLLTNDGQDVFVISSVALIVYLLVDIRRVSQFIQLDSIWVVAYLAVICSEGILDADLIRLNVHSHYYDLAARYINIINFSFLAAVNIVDRVWPSSHSIAFTPAQRGKLYKWIIPSLFIAYFAFSLPYALRIVVEGRAQVITESSQIRGASDLIAGAFSQIGLILPAILAYHFFFIRKLSKIQGMLLFLIAYSPILAVQMANGTRYPLVVSIIGVLAVYNSRYPFGRLRAVKFVGLGLFGIILTNLMREIRGLGLNTDLSSLGLESDGRFLLSEGTVTYFAKMIDYFDHSGFRNGLEHLALAVFWVPRAAWIDKPTQLEYWFPRAYGDTGFAEGHSIAATFAGTAYADFGFAGAVLAWTLMGFCVGHLNRWCTHKFFSDRGNPLIILAGVFAGLMFFGVRQISTIIITIAALLGIWMIYKNGLLQQGKLIGRPHQGPDVEVTISQLPSVRIEQPEANRIS